MTHYKRGDVVLVDVTFSDGTGIKKRPALVISCDKYHYDRREVVISAITSNVTRILFGDTKIEKWREAGLLFPSLSTGIIQTINSGMINRKLGNLEETDLSKTMQNLTRVLS